MADHYILSLDLGSTFGWALGKNGVITHSDEVCLSSKDSHPGTRFLRFQDFLHNFKNVNEILYEDVMRFESGASAKVYCGLLSVLQLFCLVHRIRLCAKKPTSVKMMFTGKGNANKIKMCEVAHRLGWKNGMPETDIAHNECDAIALLWVIYVERNVEPRFA